MVEIEPASPPVWKAILFFCPVLNCPPALPSALEQDAAANGGQGEGALLLDPEIARFLIEHVSPLLEKGMELQKPVFQE